MKVSVRTLVLFMIISIFLLACAAGCNMQNPPAQKPQSQQSRGSQDQVQVDHVLAEAVKQEVETIDGVEESTAVVINRDISVAARVTGFDRLRLRSIRQEMASKAESIAPGYKVHVSTDKKVFAELQKVENQINQSRVKSMSGLKNRVKKLNQDMHG